MGVGYEVALGQGKIESGVALDGRFRIRGKGCESGSGLGLGSWLLPGVAGHHVGEYGEGRALGSRTQLGRRHQR